MVTAEEAVMNRNTYKANGDAASMTYHVPKIETEIVKESNSGGTEIQIDDLPQVVLDYFRNKGFKIETREVKRTFIKW